MTDKIYIPIDQLCAYYQTESHFFIELDHVGLIDLVSVEETRCIHREQIVHVEKLIRMQKDLNINAESMDVIMNLLNKIEDLQQELQSVKSRLGLYE